VWPVDVGCTERGRSQEQRGSFKQQPTLAASEVAGWAGGSRGAWWRPIFVPQQELPAGASTTPDVGAVEDPGAKPTEDRRQSALKELRSAVKDTTKSESRVIFDRTVCKDAVAATLSRPPSMHTPPSSYPPIYEAAVAMKKSQSEIVRDKVDFCLKREVPRSMETHASHAPGLHHVSWLS
jgi:hypothetical protein